MIQVISYWNHQVISLPQKDPESLVLQVNMGQEWYTWAQNSWYFCVRILSINDDSIPIATLLVLPRYLHVWTYSLAALQLFGDIIAMIFPLLFLYTQYI